MRNKILLFCIVFIFIAISAFADTVVLKSGKTIQGAITKMTADALELEFEGTSLTYYLSEIDSINGQKVDVSSAAPGENFTAEEKPAEAASEEVPAEGVEEEAPSKELVLPDASEFPEQAPQAAKSPTAFLPFGKNIPASMPKLGLLLGGAMVFIVFIWLVSYIYFALCLYFIAKKTNTEPAWLAWIPIANLVLSLKIASLSYWWLLIFLAVVIPIIGPLAVMAFSLYVWYKIVLARNKPGWLVILLIVPLANIVVMGYLAFSE